MGSFLSSAVSTRIRNGPLGQSTANRSYTAIPPVTGTYYKCNQMVLQVQLQIHGTDRQVLIKTQFDMLLSAGLLVNVNPAEKMVAELEI